MQQSIGPHWNMMRLLAGVVLLASWPTATPAQRLPAAAAQQRSSAPALRREGRPASDQEHARSQREQGQNRSFEELLKRAGEIGRGQYLGVEPDISRNIYRFKFMRPGGNVVWVDIDGRTGRELAVRQ